MPKISVIIPTYNRAQMLCECICSVLNSGYANLEVVVVDDCSPDDTQDRVMERFGSDPRVVYFRTPVNSFSATARNAGGLRATGDFFFFLDDDNLLEKDCLRELLAVFARHPTAAFVAPLTVQGSEGDDRIVSTTGSFYNPWTSRSRDTTPPDCRLSTLPEGLEWRTAYSPNAFMVTRSAFEKVGGFDEGFRIMFEETDFGYRVTSIVGEGWISRLARTNHLGYLETGKHPRLRVLGIEREKRAYSFGYARIKFARRHSKWYQSLVATWLFAPMIAMYYIAVSIRCGRLGPGVAYACGTVAGLLGFYKTKFAVNKEGWH